MLLSWRLSLRLLSSKREGGGFHARRRMPDDYSFVIRISLGDAGCCCSFLDSLMSVIQIQSVSRGFWCNTVNCICISVKV